WAAASERMLGGLIATSILLASASLRPLDTLWEWVSRSFGIDAARGVLGGLLFVALAVPAFLIVRAMRGGALLRGPVTSVLNRLAAVLVIVVVVFHVGPDLATSIGAPTQSDAPVSINPPAGERPDIYMILMDGYPRADVLQRRFGFDNQPFIDELSSRGFEVADESRSNYVFTQMTLASMFQMRHIEDTPGLAPLIGTPGGHVAPLREAITRGPVWSALRTAGYRIVVNLAGYEHVSLRSVGHVVLDHGEMNDLERVVLGRTWLLDLVKVFVPDIYAQPWHDRILRGFGDLEELAAAGESRSEPTFAWVHIPAPHLPLVVNVDGSTRHLDPRRFDPLSVAGFGLNDAQMRAAYTDEVTYLNQRLLKVIGAIQDPAAAAPGRPEPVIVIFSDHGYYYDRTDTQARFASFLAASTPGAPGLLGGSPTPVNYFPLLLNRYLGTDFPRAEDRYFVSPDTRGLLQLTEVPNPDRPAARH
ncbi:MAG: hypothetical protein WD116_01255, partial [Chloroflexota bacterium]